VIPQTGPNILSNPAWAEDIDSRLRKTKGMFVKMSKKKKSARKAVIIAVIVVVVVALLALAVLTRRRGTNYNEVTAKTGNITTYYNFSGNISAVNSQTLYASKVMQIKSINVTEGQAVKKDDVLMTTMAGENITAPFDGTVSAIYAAANEQQMTGNQLCKVVDYNNLELDVQVDEYDLAAISTGKDATVTINALNKDITGKVTYVAQEGVTQNGVSYFDAKVSLPGESDLRVGMTAQAKVLNKSVTGVNTLPMSSIQFDGSNQSYVYMRDGKQVKKVDVTLGVNDGTTVEVQSGLKSGDTVLVPPTTSTAATGFGMGRARQSDNAQGSSSALGSVSRSGVSGGGNGQ
jgi:multidrug efflux pump subunit AcrA (membrane-fusion protein)